jgi:hypothetical protein
MGKQITQMDHILTRCLKTIEDLGWTVEDCLQRHAPLRQELEPMLRAALALRQGRSVKPPTVFQKTARSRLQLRLQASNRPPVPQAEKSTRILFRKWKFGAVHIITIIAVVLSTAFGGAIYAADASGPGDTLHNVDLAVENFRVKLQLKLASERLKEAEHELEGRANPENVSVALVAFDQIIAELETLVAKGDLTPEQRVETKEVITALQDAKQSSSVDMDGDAEIEKEEEGGSVDTGGDTDSTETDGADTGGSETGGEDSNEQPSEDGEDTGDSETEGADTNGSETADEHNDSDGSEHNGADTDSSETGGEDGSDSGGDGENDRDKSDD